MKEELFGFRGEVEMIYQSETYTKRFRSKNLIVNKGLEVFAKVIGVIAGVTELLPTTYPYFAVGTSSFPPSASDLSLGNEIARKLYKQTDRITRTVRLEGFFGSSEANPAPGQYIKEVGIFWPTGSPGDLVCRALVTPYAKTDVETLTIVWNWTIERITP